MGYRIQIWMGEKDGKIACTDLEVKEIMLNLQAFLERVQSTSASEEYLTTHPEFQKALEHYEVIR